MADIYDARPEYPHDLLEALAQLGEPGGCRVGDLGAGIGHLALPLAERGYAVTAIEPAERMLARLRARAAERALDVRARHAAAEALPLADESLDLVLIADALHFIDTELAAHEIARVLAPNGVLALITSELTPTPFMRDVVRLMERSAPRRPRALDARAAQLAGITKIPLDRRHIFHDETAVTPALLERILDSISFIGPAMNAERTAVFRERLRALSPSPVWARTFTLRFGRRRPARPRASPHPGSSNE